MTQPTAQDYLIVHFYEWCKRGQGWTVWEDPVEPEPPFCPFHYHYVPQLPLNNTLDDAKRHTFLSFLVEQGKNFLRPQVPKEELPDWFQAAFFIDPIPLDTYEDQVELELIIPHGYLLKADVFEQFLTMLSSSSASLAFEIIATSEKISIQFVCRESDKAQLASQLNIFFPEVAVIEQQGQLEKTFEEHYDYATIIDFGLEEEFIRPINMPHRLDPDPLQGLFGVLDDLKEGQMVVFQILFQSTANPWVTSIMNAVTDGTGKPFFENAPEMLKLAQEKVASPLYGAVIRLMALDAENDEEQELAKRIVQTMASADRLNSNALMPLHNKGYPQFKHKNDFLKRESRRLGMLLNTRELMNFIHFPGPEIISSKLNRQAKKSRPVPAIAQGHPYILGSNFHKGSESDVSLAPAQRLRHMHLIGATGVGKTTFMENLISQDFALGNGLAVLDPHGDLIESLLTRIPPERRKDVILINPADHNYPIGLNLLSAHSEVEKIVLSSDLVGMFRRLATSWGDQMTAVLANTVAAFLESDRQGTLLDLRRFLIEPDFRKQWLSTVKDPHVVYYWEKEFPQQKRSNSVISLTTRLNIFLRPKLIRNMMAQPEGLDFRAIMDQKKILLVKLSQGIIGEENSHLLGTLIVAKLHQAAQGRQTQQKANRAPFYLYIDEFQHFITDSMGSILSGARKYGLGLVLAHQGLQQLFKQDAELGNSVIANAGTRVSFRLGDLDAKKLESGYAHFDSNDLQNLGIGEALVRIGKSEDDCNLKTHLLEPVEEDLGRKIKQEVIDWSRSRYGGSETAADDALADVFNAPAQAQQPKPEVPQSKKEETPPKQEQLDAPTPKEKAAQSPSPPEVVQPEQESQIKEEVPPQPQKEAKEKVDMEAATKAYLKRQARKKENTEHQYLQTLIKKMGEARGFKATLEKPTPDGKGRVDVALESPKLRIACEISVTTKPDHEIGNLKKCLHAGYDYVFACSKRPKHLAKIKAKAEETFSKEELKKVQFFLPKDLFSFLDKELAKQAGSEMRIKGYNVKVKYSPVDQTESKQKQEDISKAILDSIKRSKKPKNKD